MKKVLFVCVENAGRSQMAEAFANRYGKDEFIVSSAGNKPADRVNPMVVEVMKEKGIDISMNKPKLLNFQMAQENDLIITRTVLRYALYVNSNNDGSAMPTCRSPAGSTTIPDRGLDESGFVDGALLVEQQHR